MERAILFDFNGVIVDDEPQHCDALIATLAEYGLPLSRDDYYREYLGFDDRECFRFAFERSRLRVDDGVARSCDRAESNPLREGHSSVHDAGAGLDRASFATRPAKAIASRSSPALCAGR